MEFEKVQEYLRRMSNSVSDASQNIHNMNTAYGRSHTGREVFTEQFEANLAGLEATLRTLRKQWKETV